jgi:putative RNA 2'-phosphotransferase
MVDRQGYASLDSLISAIRSQEEWNWVSETDVMNLLVRPDKKRFEVTDGKIRATYGHSLSTKLRYEVIIPPKVLYHGTMRASLQSILKHGILPMSRQYVHLSASIEEASAVGKRRDRNPTIIRVLALEAHKKGVKFFHAGTLFLSEKIPPEFIEVLRE